MSQQRTAEKPSLQGVNIRARKRTVKATAKHEPTVFRDQLYKHLETVPAGDFVGFANKLIQAGSTLEFLKYADVLFELLLVGGLLQPGGGYLDDGAPPSPFSVFKAQEPVEVADLKNYVEVFNKLIRRYKYLQKPLEETSLPGLLQYIHKWSKEQREKLAGAIGLLLSQGLATANSLQALTKDHLVKNDVAAETFTLVCKAYLSEQAMDHLATTLRKGGVRDLGAFFPPNKRDDASLSAYFKAAGIPQVGEWWVKKQSSMVRDSIISELKERCQHDESPEQLVEFLKAKQAEHPLPEVELVGCIWLGFTSSIDWSARPDQIEGLAMREVSKYAPVLEPFCNGAKTEVALINTVQVYCYEQTKIMKAFPNLIKVLYNQDCISDQAIIYWHQKGSKPQGRQHFISATQPLVKFLQEQEEEESEEE